MTNPLTTKTYEIKGVVYTQAHVESFLKNLEASDIKMIMSYFKDGSKMKNNNKISGKLCQIGDCLDKGKFFDGKKKSNLVRHVTRMHTMFIFEKLMNNQDTTASKTTDLRNSFKSNLTTVNAQYKLSKEIFVGKILNILSTGVAFEFFDCLDIKYFLDPISEQILGNVINSKNIKKLIIDKATCSRQKIRMILRDKLISFSLDGVKIRSESFVGVNAHVIIESRLTTIFLAIRYIPEKSTAINLAKIFKEVLDMYEIKMNQVCTMTVDNGRNYVKLTEIVDEIQNSHLTDENDVVTIDFNSEQYEYFDNFDLDFKGIEIGFLGQKKLIRCGLHTFQLAVQDSLKCHTFFWEKLEVLH